MLDDKSDVGLVLLGGFGCNYSDSSCCTAGFGVILLVMKQERRKGQLPGSFRFEDRKLESALFLASICALFISRHDNQVLLLPFVFIRSLQTQKRWTCGPLLFCSGVHSVSYRSRTMAVRHGLGTTSVFSILVQNEGEICAHRLDDVSCTC